MISVIVRNIVSNRGSVLSLWKTKHFLHFVFSNLAAFTYFSIKQKNTTISDMDSIQRALHEDRETYSKT